MSLTIATRVLDDASVSPTTRTLSTLNRIDYVDEFTARTEVTAAPEQWARVMFGDEPQPLARFIWQGLLKLDLLPGRSADTIAGWPVTGRGEDWIRLTTQSREMGAELVVQAGGGSVSLSTFVRYDQPGGRRRWVRLSRVHRLLAPSILRDADATLSSSVLVSSSPGSSSPAGP
ncbi:hypothetical protein [Microlunatus sp. Y2014]|uniref:hypothetical protein n=1 Tax=Microlunatus sp. Y2014 TaxID=3418488 RepID=UPI003DA70A3B